MTDFDLVLAVALLFPIWWLIALWVTFSSCA